MKRALMWLLLAGCDSGGGGAATTASDHGSVELVNQNAPDSWICSAQFVAMDTSACSTMVAGGCRVQRCSMPQNPFLPPSGQTVGAGDIVIHGSKMDLTLSPSGGSYGDPLTGGYLVAGDHVRVIAQGGVVPAFSGNLVLPGTMTITAPDVR